MKLQRYLDRCEDSKINYAPLCIAEYQGVIDEEALRQAFKSLYSRYPILRATVRDEAGRHLLRLTDEHHPPFSVSEGDKDSWRKEVDRHWDPFEALAYLRLIRNGDQGYVVMRVDHSIVDGRHYLLLFNELWRTYSDYVDGTRKVAERTYWLPTSPLKLLRERIGPDTVLSGSIDGESEDSPMESSDTIERVIKLEAADTRNLVATARAHGESLNALVSATIMIANRNLWNFKTKARMDCITAVDLRDRVAPPVGPTETTNFSARHRATLFLSMNEDPILLGRELRRQIDVAISKFDLSIAPFKSPPEYVQTPIEQRLATVLVSNIGIVPQIPQSPDLKITDLLIPAHSKSVSLPTIALFTYDDTLRLRLSYPSALFISTEVEELGNQMGAMLCDLGRHNA